MSVPKATRAWTIEGQNGFDSLKFNQPAPVSHAGDYEVLVKFHAASLNYRDLINPQRSVVPCKLSELMLTFLKQDNTHLPSVRVLSQGLMKLEK